MQKAACGGGEGQTTAARLPCTHQLPASWAADKRQARQSDTGRQEQDTGTRHLSRAPKCAQPPV